ncbi:MAG: DUF2071 domain-containing protein [Candidatus Poseidoniaceae archaeon]|nr:DUF2071 domain-containing protein [Candidatus Poseidoniaceae archaeon]
MEDGFRADHLPFPMPKRRHTLDQEWRFLTFMHWRVDIEKLRPHVPKGLEIDTFEGYAYIGLVPFMMKHVRPSWFVSTPGISNFPEFNIRTYVKKDGIAGVFFLTLEAKSLVTCNFAPRTYGLPYRYAKGSVKKIGENWNWNSSRNHGLFKLAGTTEVIGEQMQAQPGSLEEFLFERYSLYTSHKGSLRRGYTHHNKWKFQLAKVDLTENSLTESFNLGIEQPLTPELVHYSDGVRVRSFSIELAERIGTDINRDFLLLDGDCGLCHRLATFLDKRMKSSANLGYRPNSSEGAQRLIQAMPKKYSESDTVYLVRNGQPYMRSSAAIRCLLYMKWYYRMWYPVCWLVPLPIRDIAYRIVAKYRHKVFKKPKVCTFRVD